MVYEKNIGFEEMMKFVTVATVEEQAEMDAIVAREDWKAYKALVGEVLSESLK